MHSLGTQNIDRRSLLRRGAALAGVSVLAFPALAQAGAEVGYESEAAFNRAFKKYVGMPPGLWRKGTASPSLK